MRCCSAASAESGAASECGSVHGISDGAYKQSLCALVEGELLGAGSVKQYCTYARLLSSD